MIHNTNPTAVRITRLEDSLASVLEAGHEAIDKRLTHLDSEWSVGRMVKATTGVLILGGLALAFFVNPWFAIVPTVGGLVLAQSLVSCKSWLGQMFAGMGFRTSCEIDHERMALKANSRRLPPPAHDPRDRGPRRHHPLRGRGWPRLRTRERPRRPA